MKTIRPLLFYAILFLFFFQLLTDFIGAIYAFGLLGTSIPPELAFVLLLFSPALLFLVRRPGPRLLTALLLIILLARVIEPALGTRGRMMLAGAGVAAWLMFFPLLLWRAARRPEADAPLALTAGLLLATLTSALLRALGAGVDVSVMGWGQSIGVLLALLGLGLWLGRENARESTIGEGKAGFGRVLRLSLGLMTVLILMYFAFAAPYVMARWTGVDAFWVLLIMLISWVAFAWTATWFPALLHLRKGWLILWNIAFALALLFTLSNNQPWLPDIPHLYPRTAALAAPHPLDGRDVTPMPPFWRPFWYGVPLIVMLLLSPVLYLDFHRQLTALRKLRPSVRQLGGAFTIAALFLLLAIFAHVFTTVYDYIPVVGPFFRNGLPLVYFFVALMLLPGVMAAASGRAGPSGSKTLLVGVVLLGFITLGAHEIITAHPQPAPSKEAITLLTYNIQEGYSAAGQKNYQGQLAQIKALHPDIIGLQESDTARIANSNDDVVRYFADHLSMYSYYGPKTVTGTFGVAILSRYPIENAETFFLYSKGEQVAAIEAVIDVGDQPLRVLVTHLGNGGPMIQQQQFLELVGDAPRRTLALGDFNFRPDTPQYALTTQTLLDTWTQKWPDWQDDQGQKPKRKIDHIFISPDLRVLDARYVPEGPSDHPAVTAVVRR